MDVIVGQVPVCGSLTVNTLIFLEIPLQKYFTCSLSPLQSDAKLARAQWCLNLWDQPAASVPFVCRLPGLLHHKLASSPPRLLVHCPLSFRFCVPATQSTLCWTRYCSSCLPYREPRANSSPYVKARTVAGCNDKEVVAAFQPFKVATGRLRAPRVGWLQVVGGICIHNSHKPVFYLTPWMSVLFHINTKHIYGTSRKGFQRQFYGLLPSPVRGMYGL